MSFRDLFRDVLDTLWSNKMRTFLTMFGISWGIVSIVLMVAAGEGFRVGQQKQQETFAKDLMIVFAGRTSLQAGGTRAGRRIRFDMHDVAYATENSPSCQNVMPELEQDTITVRSAYNNSRPTVTGSYPEFAQIRSLDIAEGRFYNWQDVNEGRRVAFMGSDAAKQLFPHDPPVGRYIYLNNIQYLVVGVMRKKEQNSSYDGWDVNKIFVPFTAMVEDFPNKPPALPKTIDQLLVTPKSVAEHESCKLQLRAALAHMHDYDPHDKEAASIWDTIEEAKAFQQMTDGMKYFLGAVGVTTLLLGGLGVMNVMLVAVRERTREIGVRKAVGANSASIMRQFFLETMIIVFLSGGVGLALAFGICGLINLLPMPPFFAGMLPTWTSGLTAVGLLGLIAVLAALYPSNKAASIDPIEALRYEAGG